MSETNEDLRRELDVLRERVHGLDDAPASFPVSLPDGGEITADDAFGLVGRELLALGNAMATAIEERWTGDGDCDCPVCTAARAWRSAVPRDGA